MSLFSSIMSKIFHRKPSEPVAPAPPATAQAAAAATAPPPPPPPVDVEAVLNELAAQKGRGGNWRTSIVDLLKMLDLDSSLGRLLPAPGDRRGFHGSRMKPEPSHTKELAAP